MAAAQAVQAEIRAGSQNLPPLFPTGMGLFHSENVIYEDVRRHFLSAKWVISP